MVRETYRGDSERGFRGVQECILDNTHLSDSHVLDINLSSYLRVSLTYIWLSSCRESITRTVLNCLHRSTTRLSDVEALVEIEILGKNGRQRKPAPFSDVVIPIKL